MKKLLIAMSLIIGATPVLSADIDGSVESRCTVATTVPGIYGNPNAYTLTTLPASAGQVPIVRVDTSLANAYVVKSDSDEVWYIQDSDTKFEPFVEGEVISETDGSGAGTLDASGVDGDSFAYINGDVDISTGEVMYIDNRAAIQRSADQTEDIKIIIQL